MSPVDFQQSVLNWFDSYGRKELPWQQDINPYRVWVSEIMLQQTQVVTVITYYQRFMRRFPDVSSLAQASLDDVLQHWSGLGYYARARNLHAAARLIATRSNRFPDTLEALMALPGIGRSTAGAILSIAFQRPHPILDGNVRRVLARFHGLHGWSGDRQVNKQFWELSGQYTPQYRVAEYTQAIMDLGATVCQRSHPVCQECPVSSACYALRESQIHDLPTAKSRKKLPVKRVFFLLLRSEQSILLVKRPPGGIWGGLWSFPEFDCIDTLQRWCAEKRYPVRQLAIMPEQRHTFSHFHLDYIPVIVDSERSCNNVMEAKQSVWCKARLINSIGLPAPIKKLLQQQYEADYGKNG